MIPFLNTRKKGIALLLHTLCCILGLSGCGKGLLSSLSGNLTSLSPGGSSGISGTRLTSLYCTTSAATNATKYAGGSGTTKDPYLLCTEAQVIALGQSSADWSSSFLVLQNINLAMSTLTPIGNTLTAFQGVFDGGGFTLSNISLGIGGPTNNTGFFGVSASPAQIKNLKLTGLTLTSSFNAGGLLGIDNGGTTISNCSTAGSLYTNGGNAGGLVGIANGSVISSSNSAVSVMGTSSTSNWGTGGLVGTAINATITKSFATGNVTAPNITNGNAGGLVGIANSASTISQSYASGAAVGNYAGGLVAALGSGSVITDSYATGAPTGTTAAGGLVGTISNASTGAGYNRCYAYGAVSGALSAGGILGQDQGSGSIYANSFFSPGLTLQANAVGTPAVGISATQYGSTVSSLTSTEQSTFTTAGWDFSTPIWIMLSTTPGTFPTLSWQ